MEITVKERLMQFIASQKISIRSFERSIGVGNGYVNGIRMSIQPDKLERIVELYPKLNIGWLVAGQGEMLLNQPKEAPSISNTGDNNEIITGTKKTLNLCPSVDDSVKELEKLKVEMAKKEAENQILREMIQDMKDLLKNMASK